MINLIKKYRWQALLIVVSLTILTIVSLKLPQIQKIVSHASGQSVLVSISPSQATLPPNKTFQVFLNSEKAIVFARVVVTFDKTKLKLVKEPQILDSRFTNSILKTSMNEANNTGKIVWVAGIDPLQKSFAPKGSFQFANMTFDLITPSASTSSLILNTGDSEVVAISDDRNFVIPLTVNSSNSVLTLNPVTQTPTPTPTQNSLIIQNLLPSGNVAPVPQNITWNPVSGAVMYYIRIDDLSNPWVCNGVDPGGDVCVSTVLPSYNYNFKLGHSYNVWVHAVYNSAGTNYSVSTANLINAVAIPPTNLQPSGQMSAGLKDVTWSPVSGALMYYIRVNDLSDGWVCNNITINGDVCLTTTGPKYSYDFKSGHTYNIWVHAVYDSAGKIYSKPTSTLVKVN